MDSGVRKHCLRTPDYFLSSFHIVASHNTKNEIVVILRESDEAESLVRLKEGSRFSMSKSHSAEKRDSSLREGPSRSSE
jgi:hypothetical protein